MEIATLDGFAFVDCYFHGFAADPLLSKINLRTEAYFPGFQNGGERKLGILSITLDEITDLQANIRPPFTYDLEANEVFEMTLKSGDGGYDFSVTSDYLALSIKCKQVSLEESQ